jgi:hypothetical protein
VGLDHELVGLARDAEGVQAPPRRERHDNVVVPQSVPEGSILYRNHRSFRSEDIWAGFDVDRSAERGHATPFVGLTASGVLYGGYYG